ncbi:MAG TPA: exodeoxyribonuclease VII large subunit [Stellaceae bacterium]|jgi:exodeoxyribonuclease VII large subunit|nr:exodeoxyribonuclease VII large subunit [Stellaceae bacterium]
MTEIPSVAQTAPGAAPRANLPEYTVSELSSALKRRIEESFSYVRVRGEISGFKRHSSGHCYLALKDEDAVLDAVCWRGTALRLTVKPEDGMEVVCTGRLTTFPGRSKYQLVLETMELAGVGALLKLLDDRKLRLAAEGLFAEERKRKLPFLPAVIGVVTSPTGAVIRDILHRLADRFPRHVLIWPVAVQGDGAAAQIAAAIAGFNAIAPPDSEGGGPVPRPDLLIVARGGGSLEDLMPFNEEIVVRAVAASTIPLISAVGHETDTTLIDLASDRRAPTPSAAAEMAVPVRLDLRAELAAKAGRLSGGLARLFADRRVRLEGLARGLPDPLALIGAKAQLLDDRSERLGFALRSRLRLWRGEIATLAARLRHPRQQIDEKNRVLAESAQRARRAFEHFLALERRRIAGLAERLRGDLLRIELERARRRLADHVPRLDGAVERLLRQRRERLDNLGGRLDSLSPLDVLRRGYAVVRDAKREVITSAAAIGDDEALIIGFHDGEVLAVSGARRRPAKRPPDRPQQPKLL